MERGREGIAEIRKARGFSIAEALISFFLVGLTVTTLFHVFPMTRKGLHQSENYARAALLGRSLLADARRVSFGTLAPLTGNRQFSGSDNGAPFSVTIEYRVDVQALDAARKLVWATMSWRESNQDRSLVIETLIVERD